MDRRQMIGAAAAVVGLGSVGYAFFAPVSDEELIADTLSRLAQAMSFSEPIGNVVFHGSHLSEQFKELFTETVQIRVSEVRGSIPSHHGKLGLAAARGLSRYSSLDITFSIDELNLNGESADVTSTATVMGSLGGELKRDTRPVLFTFAQVDGDWLIQSAIVRAPED